MTTFVVVLILVLALAGVVAYLVQERRVGKAKSEAAEIKLALTTTKKDLAKQAEQLEEAWTTITRERAERDEGEARLNHELESFRDHVANLEARLVHAGDAPAVGEHVRDILLGDSPGPDPSTDPSATG